MENNEIFNIIKEEFLPYAKELSNYTNEIIDIMGDSCSIYDDDFLNDLDTFKEVLSEYGILDNDKAENIFNKITDFDNPKSINDYRDKELYNKLESVCDSFSEKSVDLNFESAMGGTKITLYSDIVELEQYEELGFLKRLNQYNNYDLIAFDEINSYISSLINKLLSVAENEEEQKEYTNQIIDKKLKYDDIVEIVNKKTGSKYVKISEIVNKHTEDGKIIICDEIFEQLKIIKNHYRENEIQSKNIFIEYIKNNPQVIK